MKLFVDDLRKPPDGWEVARTNTDAIRILATCPVDEVSLDHDIMVPEYGGDSAHAKLVIARMSAETFMPVAYYLALAAKYSHWSYDYEQPKIRFHTGNLAMGQKMAEIIGVKFDWWQP